MNYRHFDTDWAREIGVHCAVLMEEIIRVLDYYKSSYVYSYYQSEENCKYECGRYWGISSIKWLKSILCYLPDIEIKCVLEDCLDNDYIRIEKIYSSKTGLWDKNEIWISIGDSMSQYTGINQYEARIKRCGDRYSGNKDFVKERDENKCRICGKTDNIVVHHIDGYNSIKPENNARNKLILLCSSCHRKVHAKNPAKKLYIPKEELERIGYFEDKEATENASNKN